MLRLVDKAATTWMNWRRRRQLKKVTVMDTTAFVKAHPELIRENGKLKWEKGGE